MHKLTPSQIAFMERCAMNGKQIQAAGPRRFAERTVATLAKLGLIERNSRTGNRLTTVGWQWLLDNRNVTIPRNVLANDRDELLPRAEPTQQQASRSRILANANADAPAELAEWARRELALDDAPMPLPGVAEAVAANDGLPLNVIPASQALATLAAIDAIYDRQQAESLALQSISDATPEPVSSEMLIVGSNLRHWGNDEHTACGSAGIMAVLTGGNAWCTTCKTVRDIEQA